MFILPWALHMVASLGRRSRMELENLHFQQVMHFPGGSNAAVSEPLSEVLQSQPKGQRKGTVALHLLLSHLCWTRSNHSHDHGGKNNVTASVTFVIAVIVLCFVLTKLNALMKHAAFSIPPATWT